MTQITQGIRREEWPDPQWVLTRYRLGATVDFGPFPTAADAIAYDLRHGIRGVVHPLHPPVDEIDWEGSRLREEADRTYERASD